MELPTPEVLHAAVTQRAEDLDHVVGYVLDDLKKAVAEGASIQHAAFTLRQHYVQECLSGRVFVIDTLTTELEGQFLDEEPS